MADALDIIRVVAEMALVGQKILNIYDFVATDPTDDADLMSDLGDWIEDAMADIKMRISNNLSFSSLQFKNVTQATDMGFTSWPTFTVGGDATNEVLPLGVAGLVTMPTAVSKVRGRKFLCGITEAYCEDGVWTAATVTDLIAYGDILINPIIGTLTGSPIAYGVVKALGGFQPVVAYDVVNVPSYQRRRKQGVGA